jgi:predicted amidohydrolase YtcJ
MMELLLYNATLHSARSDEPGADALLISGHRIARVGRSKRLRREAGEGAPAILEIDLAGRSLLPGFVDAHTHIIQESLAKIRFDLGDVRSKDELVERVRERVKETGAEEVIVGEGWDDSRWGGGCPTRGELDRVAPRHPVVLRRVCGHLAVANSLALARIGEKWEEVDRESGLLRGMAALKLNRIFPPRREELVQALRYAEDAALRSGVTSIHEIAPPSILELCVDERASEGLRIRIYFTVPYGDAEALRATGFDTGAGDEWLRIGGAKIMADGSIGAKTAALFEPYVGDPANRGMLIHTDEEMIEIVSRLHSDGLQVLVHAIGDRAVRQVIDAYERVIGGGPNALRHRIEHVEMVSPGDLERMARLGIVACMQPNFVVRWGRRGGMYEALIGKERLDGSNRFGTMRKKGIRVAFGSDCMPLSPLYGLDGAVGHTNPEESLSVQEAVDCYTWEGAYAGFEDNEKGTIEEGKLADLVVLSGDLRKASKPSDLEVAATIIGGEVAYGELPGGVG